MNCLENDKMKLMQEEREDFKQSKEVPQINWEEVFEKKESAFEDKETLQKRRKELEEELKRLELSYQEKIEAEKEAEKLRKEEAKKQIERLFVLAQEKGLPYAIEVAKSMKDPFILDLFHDLLAKDQTFKRFL